MTRKNSMYIHDKFNVNMLPINDDKFKEFIVSDGDGSSLGEGRTLLTRLAASHWGYVNKNGFWYDPETVDGTIPTWTQPFQKPVLTYHPRLGDNIDPIGRIRGVKYSLGVARSFIEDEVIPNNKPHGHLEFVTRISDPEAIPKVLDGRYDTVSISAIASNVICSVCGEKVAINDSSCSHLRFKRYNKEGDNDDDGKLCYYSAGPLLGRHVAFVISPSDIYAGVKEAEFESPVKDTTRQDLLMELFVLSDEARVLLNLHDESSVNIFDLLDDKERKSMIFDILVAPDTPVSVDDKSINTDNKDRKEGEDMEKLEWMDLVPMTEQEIHDKLEEDPEGLTEDAKLTYAARKKLPDSAFCGPGRSFPAHDAAHVRNGLARLNQSKGKPKAKILSCLRARAKKHGIKVSTKVKNDGQDDWLLESVTVHDVVLAEATIEDIMELEIVTKHLEDNYTAVSTDGKPATVNTDDATKADDATKGDDTTSDKATGNEEVKALTAKLKDREAEVAALTADKSKLHKDHKDSIVDRIIDLETWLRRAEDGDEHRAQLMERTTESLSDKLADLRGEMEAGATPTPKGTVDSKGVDGDTDPDTITTDQGKNNDTEPKISSREARQRRHFPEEFDE